MQWSTTYPISGEPPSYDGAAHDSETDDADLSTTLKASGACGAVTGSCGWIGLEIKDAS